MTQLDARPSESQKLLDKVIKGRNDGKPVSATLKTDERVFARITDGIYREPASALRELIANAYDADATTVRIETDAPRFSRITVRDDGSGLSEDALVHVLCHIGGSLKRTDKGREFNVVSESDSLLSPMGRRLIGKLGIGLFSVSQLTHHLIIVTKVKGDKFRRVCDILLMPQSDASTSDSETGFVTGTAIIQAIPADDIDSHGTEITLLDVRQFVRESLQSAALWQAVSAENEDEEDSTGEDNNTSSDNEMHIGRPNPPHYHIGRVKAADSEEMLIEPALPWEPTDSPLDKFSSLVHAVKTLGNETKERMFYTDVLDTYLSTIWTLSLAVPVNYIASNPLDLHAENTEGVYALTNNTSRLTKAEPLKAGSNLTIREAAAFKAGSYESPQPFSVFLDEIELRRPLEFIDGDAEKASNGTLFVGKIASSLASLPNEYSGGPVEFEAYFSYQKKISPASHNGLLIRINGASGILFDDRFLKYQVAEINRLRQISAEVFIIRGLDAALNIDRESFNISHPHYQFLQKWVRNALRQIMSRIKAGTAVATGVRLDGGLNLAAIELRQIVQAIPRPLFIDVAPKAALEVFETQEFIFSRSEVLAHRPKAVSKKEKIQDALFEKKIDALVRVLDGYEFFSKLPETEKNDLLSSIAKIFTVDLKND